MTKTETRKIRLSDITVTRTFPGGYLELSVILDGYRFHRLYSGYSVKDAKRLFRNECEIEVP